MNLIFSPIISFFALFSLCMSSHTTDVLSFPPMERIENRRVQRLELSPNDDFLVTLLSDRTLRLFDMRGETPRQLLEVAGTTWFQQEDERHDFAFSKDGTRLAVSYKEKVEIYSLKPTFSLETSLNDSWKGMVTAISFTYDGQSIAIARSYKELQIIDLATQKINFSRRISSKIHGIASLKDNAIVTISQETPMIWRFSNDYRTLFGNHLLEFYQLPSVKVSSSSDGETIYIEDRAIGFIAYDATSASIIGKGVSAEVQDSGMTISNDGSLAALSCLDEINIYNAKCNSQLIRQIRLPNSYSFKTAFSQTNNNILYIGQEGRIFTYTID